MADVFAKGGGADDREAEVKELHAKIGVRRERHAFE